MDYKEFKGIEHTHMIFKDNQRCSTCWLRQETFTKLDELAKNKLPYRKNCSNCGNRIELGSRFSNDAIPGDRFMNGNGEDMMFTNCEECRIKMREIRKRKN